MFNLANTERENLNSRNPNTRGQAPKPERDKSPESGTSLAADAMQSHGSVQASPWVRPSPQAQGSQASFFLGFLQRIVGKLTGSVCG